MIKKILVAIMLLGPPVYLMACALIRDFCNNRDQKKRVVTIVRSEDDRAVIGDCTMIFTPFDAAQKSAPSERMRRLREIEPRGA